MNKIIKVGVGVMILNNNKILLGHRCQNYLDSGGIYEPSTWTLPGGKQEFDETIYEACIRETKEETNLDISDLVLYNVVDDISLDKHFVTLQFITTSYSGLLKVNEPLKIDDWKWFDLDDLPSNLYSPSKKFIESYLSKIKG